LSSREIAAFALAALRYWLAVFPRTCHELRRWRRRAAQIPDPALRQAALDALSKRGNIEGAAAFAAAGCGWRRGSVVRALVSFQAAYNYADMLAEQPSRDPVGRARRLHGALLAALDPDAAFVDWCAHDLPSDDGGYLAETVHSCQTALLELPSYASVAAPARRAAARIVAFQSLSLGERGALERWARTLLPTESGLEWWEAAAAAGSSLGVHALIAAAAKPSLHVEDVVAIEDAYFPWIGALHSLLDSLVDEAEDAASGQFSLVGCYRSLGDAASNMGRLAERALGAARELPHGRRQAVLLAAMACSYLSAPEASSPDALAAARSVRHALGGLARPALVVFKLRALTARCGRAGAGAFVRTQAPSATVCLAETDQGVDAGAA
jgi:tetraprenyl-beta-curcumene synthase